jgi:type I restriction enzyme R subunit
VPNFISEDRIERALLQKLQQNRRRADFAERLRQIIGRYNAGGSANENYFEERVRFTRDLHREEERHLREGLSEDELEVFDLLKKEKTTQDEERKVKPAARALLKRLTTGTPRVLVQEWYKETQSKKRVENIVGEILHETLPESYDRALFKTKCDEVFGLVLDYASQGRKWAA